MKKFKFYTVKISRKDDYPFHGYDWCAITAFARKNRLDHYSDGYRFSFANLSHNAARFLVAECKKVLLPKRTDYLFCIEPNS